MLSGDESKPIEKSDKRKRKADGKKRKPAQQKAMKADQLRDTPEAVAAPVVPMESAETAALAVESSAVMAEDIVISSIDTAGEEPTGLASPDAGLEGRQVADRPDALPDRFQDALKAVTAAVASIEHSPAVPDTSDSAAVAAAETSEIAAAATVAAASAAAAQTAPVSYQTIANAYGNLTRHSIDQTRSFFERLAGVRSIDKAIELQTEFARQAYDSFMAESRKIRDLHGEMARQRLKHWESLVSGMTRLG